MKKIGFVIPWFAEDIHGGAEMALKGITKHLAANRIDLEILTTCVEKFESDWSVDYYPEGLEVINDINVRRFKVKKRDTVQFDKINYKFINNIPVSIHEETLFLREMVNSPSLYEYIRKYKEDYSLFVFIPYMFGTTYFGCEQCLEKAVLLPCFHDESYAHMELFKQRYSKVRGMIFHSKAEYDFTDRVYDLSNVTTAVLGDGVDTDIQSDALAFRNKYKISEPFLIYAGRKDKGKNVDTLIKYFGLYKKRNLSNLKLILIGGGKIDIPNELKSDIYDLGFVPVQDKYDAFSAAEFLCNPSKFESFSLIIMENWLCQKPVLVNENCAVTKNFASEANGGLYFNDYYEFEACTNYLIEHKKESALMGENGKKYVISNFSWDIIVEKYVNFFKQCIE